MYFQYDFLGFRILSKVVLIITYIHLAWTVIIRGAEYLFKMLVSVILIPFSQDSEMT